MAKRSRIKKQKRSRRPSPGSIFILKILFVGFLLLNVITYAGAYGLTHFREPGEWSLGRSRPNSPQLPSDEGLAYITQKLPINEKEWLDTWLIPAANPQGTILLFHGNGSSKSSQLLTPAKVFHELGYNALLVDFRGVGGSSGNTTTLGAKEAKDVVIAFNYAQQKKLRSPLILYGISMGSAAVMNAIHQDLVQPDAVILELPFAKLINAIKSRLAAVKMPTFPLGELILFWGSIQHGFNGFTHNPVNYAKSIQCPTLVLYGALDRWTTEIEIQQIVENLPSQRALTLFPNAGHQSLVTVDIERWQDTMTNFLEQLK